MQHLVTLLCLAAALTSIYSVYLRPYRGAPVTDRRSWLRERGRYAAPLIVAGAALVFGIGNLLYVTTHRPSPGREVAAGVLALGAFLLSLVFATGLWPGAGNR